MARRSPDCVEFDPRALDGEDLYGALAQLRGHGRIVHSPRLGAWCVTGYDDIAAILRNDADFSARGHKPRPTVDVPPDVAEILAGWSCTRAPMGTGSPRTRWPG
ncbi:hypothetical protein [Streptomyces sp. NRRL B-24572]|uniref:hypothetical protein n=1 Tax=Streptomyces sp. NRRL B-24572 TaxID=1962156 RepID=UPI00117CFF45|nr:hypothetical protein [Streptomyces sp. NRRL B-24572]